MERERSIARIPYLHIISIALDLTCSSSILTEVVCCSCSIVLILAHVLAPLPVELGGLPCGVDIFLADDSHYAAVAALVDRVGGERTSRGSRLIGFCETVQRASPQARTKKPARGRIQTMWSPRSEPHAW